MSNRRRRTTPPAAAAGESNRKAEQSATGSAASAATAGFDAPVLKPRKGLFIVLMIALVIWVGFLVTLYLTTVRAPRARRQQDLNHPATSLSDIHCPRAMRSAPA